LEKDYTIDERVYLETKLESKDSIVTDISSKKEVLLDSPTMKIEVEELTL